MSAPPGSRRRALLARTLTAVVLAVVLAIPAAADWRQFHAGPARLGVSPGHVLSRDNVRHLRVLWSRAAGKSAEGVNASAAVAGSRVFVGSDDGRLYAFGLGGRPLWSRWVGGAIRSSPAVADGVVYVGSNDGRVQAR